MNECTVERGLGPRHKRAFIIVVAPSRKVMGDGNHQNHLINCFVLMVNGGDSRQRHTI